MRAQYFESEGLTRAKTPGQESASYSFHFRRELVSEVLAQQEFLQ